MRPFTPFLCLAAIAAILIGRAALSAPLPSPVATGHSRRAKRMDDLKETETWIAENGVKLIQLLDEFLPAEANAPHVHEPSSLPTQQWASSSGVSAQPALSSYDPHGYAAAQHYHPGGIFDDAGSSMAGQPHGHGIYHHNAHWPFSGDAQDFHQPAPEQYERGTTGMESYEPAHEQALAHDHGHVEHLLPPDSRPLATLSRIDMTSQQAAALFNAIIDDRQPQDGLMQVGEALLAKSRVLHLVSVTSSMGPNARSFLYADAALNVWLQRVYQLRLAKANNAASYKVSSNENAEPILDSAIFQRVDRFRKKHKNPVASTGSSLDTPGSGLDSFTSNPFEVFKVGDYWLRATKAKGGLIVNNLPSSVLRVTAYTLDHRPPIIFGEIKVEEFKPQQ